MDLIYHKERMDRDLETCQQTDKGIRAGNEDACGIWRINGSEGTFTLLAVADGLGGHPAGEVASRLALDALSKRITSKIAESTSRTGDLHSIMLDAFRFANSVVISEGEEDEERLGMGTTLVAALVPPEGEVVVGNIGDSRAYLLDGSIRRITRDHSKVQELVEAGVVTPEYADRHPLKNIVTHIIGRRGELPDIYSVYLENARILLCSDGLIDGLTEDEIHTIALKDAVSLACRRLVEAAKEKSRDNITVVMATYRR
jgi:serine/threonine protein phosphatase PrpC